MNICAIILSAGKSKRFKSSKPKFLHEISGKALIQFNIDAFKKIKQVKKTFIETEILKIGECLGPLDLINSSIVSFLYFVNEYSCSSVLGTQTILFE